MATRELYPKQAGTTILSGTDWSLTDGGATGQTEPTAEDNVHLTANSALVTLDKDATCLSFDASAYTSTFDSATFGITAGGDFKFNAGTATWTNVASCILTVNGSGDLENAGYLRVVKELVVAGTPTLTANFFARKATVTGILSADAAELLEIGSPGVAWWGTQTGTVNCNVEVRNPASGPGGTVTLNGSDLTVLSSVGDKTLTLDADVDVGAGTVALDTTGVGDDITLTGTGILTAAAVTLDAFNDAGASCTLNLDGETHAVGSIAGVADNNGVNALALGTCTINDMVAGIDGTKIDTVTATVVHLYGNGSTTTIKNVTLSSGEIICHQFDRPNCTGNSSHIRFAGGGRMMRGIGG